MATLIDSYSETNGDGNEGIYAAVSALGQTFTTTALALDSAKFYIGRLGSPTGNVFSKLYALTGTHGTNAIPTGSALATSDPIDITTITTGSSLVTFTFSGANRYVMTNGVAYGVTVEFAGGDGSNLLQVRDDASSPTHAGNLVVFVTGTGWIATSAKDTCFYVYGVPAAVDVTVNLTGVSGSPAIGVLGFNGSMPLVGVAATSAIGTGAVGIIGGFNPATITGLVVWLKADSLLVSDGGPVSPWPDMSGNANDGVVTATPPPVVRAGALNGLGVVRFSYQQGRIRGDTDLALSGLPAPGYNYSILYIGRMVGPNVGRIFAGTFPATNFLVGFHTSSVDIAYDGAFIGPVVGYPAGTPTRWKQYSYTASHDGTTYDSDFYISGTTIGGLATGSGLQSRYNLSGYDATGDQETCDCEVAELLIYNHKLSDADRISVEQYLNDKWLNVVLGGVAANPQIGIGAVAIESIAPPDQGLVAGGSHRFWLEDETEYLQGVAATPEIGKITAIARGTLEDLERMFPFPRPPEAPKRIRRLVPPKPVPRDVFMYMAGVNTMPRVGTGRVNAFYEDIDEETIALLDLLS